MNTDNMTISGETIDYGPCAFMDTYDPQTVFSSIDEQGRYAYFNQPGIAKWNLARFAECLLPLIDKNKDKAIQIATETINNFAKLYKKSWLDMMHNKLGLLGNDSNDENLIIDLLAWMHQNKADYTNTFCFLMKKNIRKNEIYKDESFLNWKLKWEERLKLNSNSPDKSLNLMCSSNPLIIPRNHNIEEVLDSATIKKDLKPMKDLLKILEDPYKDHANISKYQLPPAQDNKNYKTFCGT
jgi:serine/tyrosine/threonine adenylyltransferase